MNLLRTPENFCAKEAAMRPAAVLALLARGQPADDDPFQQKFSAAVNYMRGTSKDMIE